MYEANLRNLKDLGLKDWEKRKKFVNFTEKDVQLLKDLSSFAKKYCDEVVDEFYKHLMAFEETKKFISDEATLKRLQGTQKEYFLGLTSGDYGKEYLENRIRVGHTHQRIGLSPQWYMGAYSIYMELVIPRILEYMKSNPAKANKTILALYKIINLDQEIAISTYIALSEEVISRQSDEILEISTPVVKIWDGVVAAPIIGTLDSKRTQQFMERLLNAIVETNSLVALVDITGVPAIDTATAQHLIETINAVKLLGSQVVITGVRPAIAQTLVHLGINLQDIITRSSMAAGLRVALDILSLKVVSKQDDGKGV